MSVVQELLSNKYQFRDLLRIYVGVLKEQKQLHEINCPDCEAKDKPCRKYYWLVLDIQELSWSIQRLDKELREITL